jgi:hypothetical protein
LHRKTEKFLEELLAPQEGESVEGHEARIKMASYLQGIVEQSGNLDTQLMKQLKELQACNVSIPKELTKACQDGIVISKKFDRKIEAMVVRVKTELKYKLIVAEKLGRPFLEINDQDIQKYQEICDQELLQDWLPKELTAKGKSQKKQGAKKTKGRRSPPQAKTKVAKAEPVARKGPSKPVTQEPISPEIQRTQFLNGLLIANPHCRLKELDRVTRRWKDATNADIRNFSDRYQSLSDEEINKQRARHLIPGLDSLLKNDQFKRIYTFPTSKGIALLSTLNYGPSSEKGIVYVGITNEKGQGKIYHKYFEPSTSKSLKGDVTNDPSQEVLPVQEENEWTHTLPFEPEIAADGTLTLRFPNELHSIHIEPVRTDLLDATIFTIAND